MGKEEVRHVSSGCSTKNPEEAQSSGPAPSERLTFVLRFLGSPMSREHFFLSLPP